MIGDRFELRDGRLVEVIDERIVGCAPVSYTAVTVKAIRDNGASSSLRSADGSGSPEGGAA